MPAAKQIKRSATLTSIIWEKIPAVSAKAGLRDILSVN